MVPLQFFDFAPVYARTRRDGTGMGGKEEKNIQVSGVRNKKVMSQLTVVLLRATKCKPRTHATFTPVPGNVLLFVPPAILDFIYKKHVPHNSQS